MAVGLSIFIVLFGKPEKPFVKLFFTKEALEGCKHEFTTSLSASHSSCSAKSSHFVRLVPASPDALGYSGWSGWSGWSSWSDLWPRGLMPISQSPATPLMFEQVHGTKIDAGRHKVKITPFSMVVYFLTPCEGFGGGVKAWFSCAFSISW